MGITSNRVGLQEIFLNKVSAFFYFYWNNRKDQLKPTTILATVYNRQICTISIALYGVAFVIYSKYVNSHGHNVCLQTRLQHKCLTNTAVKLPNQVC